MCVLGHKQLLIELLSGSLGFLELVLQELGLLLCQVAALGGLCELLGEVFLVVSQQGQLLL